MLSKTNVTGRTVNKDFTRVEIFRQGAWQELPFPFLSKGDRFRPINGSAAGVVLQCVDDATEDKFDLWVVNAKPELS